MLNTISWKQNPPDDFRFPLSDTAAGRVWNYSGRCSSFGHVAHFIKSDFAAKAIALSFITAIAIGAGSEFRLFLALSGHPSFAALSADNDYLYWFRIKRGNNS
jgi:hypothetical protein